MKNHLLNRHILVLNKSWVAVRTAPFKDVIASLIATDSKGIPKAKVIDPKSYETFNWSDWSDLFPADEECIHSGTRHFRIPEVVVLTTYEKHNRFQVSFNRKNLLNRDDSKCQYCGKKTGKEWSIDHIFPKSRGGKTDWYNCVISCLKCNSKKANRTPEECGMKLLRKPVRPNHSILIESPIMHKSWSAFISDLYWKIPLQ